MCAEQSNNDSTRFRKRFLFTALYFSEGAPIGFLWWALPAQLRLANIEVDRITAATALWVLPWTFKFLWAPAIDSLQSSRWTIRHWIVSSQLLMGLTLLPLFWLDPAGDLDLLRWLMLAHAFTAATQDVAIDALCIRTTTHNERGRLNGWMQAGMLSGRSLFGGGALILFAHLPHAAVIGLMLAATTGSALLILTLGRRMSPVEVTSIGDSSQSFSRSLRSTFAKRTTWISFAFALTAGAAYEALGALQSPLLVDLRYDKAMVGWILAVPITALMVAGSLAGGFVADRWGHRRTVALSTCGFLLCVLGVAGGQFSADLEFVTQSASFGLCASAFFVGAFVASSYAMFMDLADPRLAGTQFSAMMGATNACEAWAGFAAGSIAAHYGYGVGLLMPCLVTSAALFLLPALRKPLS